MFCVGVCTKCREKLTWRFKYDKYKSLAKIAKCQNCRKKCITKAYRTFCDPCSMEKRVCPGCCCSISPTDLAVLVNCEIEMDDGVSKLDANDESVVNTS